MYAPGKHTANGVTENVRTWAYAVTAGDSIKDGWDITAFENSQYHLKVYGPNGFVREFKGNESDPAVGVSIVYNITPMTIDIKITPAGEHEIEVIDNGNKAGGRRLGFVMPGVAKLDVSKSFGWYDFTVKAKGSTAFEKRYAGRMETGKASFSDPAMGRV